MPERHEPVREDPHQAWKHYAVWSRVKRLFADLPEYFSSVVNVTDIPVTEIFAWGSVLGATIEHEVVRTLNTNRNLWDPEDQYEQYLFYRQAEAFPDVLLVNLAEREIIMGIELKSWYLLAKEREPSFRYKASPGACNRQDLFVVVPWALSNVLSGTPQIYDPYVDNAKYVAEYRNWWWIVKRGAESEVTIRYPENPIPYPRSRDNYSDSAVNDKGNNFGRIARTGLMDEYVERLRKTLLLGISVDEWCAFLKKHRSLSVHEYMDMWESGYEV